MPGAVNFFLLPFMHLPLLFYIYLHLKKVSLIGCPQPGCLGPSHPRTPICTPLWINVWYVRYVQWRAEGLGCPGPTRFLDAHKLKKFLLIHLNKFLTTF